MTIQEKLDLVEEDSVLKDFQKTCVRFGLETDNVLIADDMGLGKTLEALKIIEYDNRFPVVIVTPASLVHNWIAEIRKWYGDRFKTFIVKNEHPIPDGIDFYLTSYDRLRVGVFESGIVEASSSLQHLIDVEPTVLILDESHNIKSHRALRTIAVQTLALHVDKRILLSGTPILNRPSELYTQLEVLQQDQFMPWWYYQYRFCDVQSGRWGLDDRGASDTGELHLELINSCMVRRRKEEVLHDLPDIVSIPINVTLTNAGDYRMAEDVFLLWLAEECKRDPKFLESIEGLPKTEQEERKADYSSGVVYRASRAEALVKLTRLKLVAARGKIEAFRDWVTDIIGSYDEKVICFHHHSEIANLVNISVPFKSASIVSNLTPKQRKNEVDRFQNDPDVKLMNCSLNVGGVGFNMTSSHVVAFLEFPWSSTIMDQAISRAHRMGQEETVRSFSFIGENTIDEHIIDLINKKRRIFNEIINGTETGDTPSMLKEVLRIFLGQTDYNRSKEGENDEG